jgi:hypothetical protein
MSKTMLVRMKPYGQSREILFEVPVVSFHRYQGVAFGIHHKVHALLKPFTRNEVEGFELDKKWYVASELSTGYGMPISEQSSSQKVFNDITSRLDKKFARDQIIERLKAIIARYDNKPLNEIAGASMSEKRGNPQVVESEESAYVQCSMCGGPMNYLGDMGRLKWFRCRNCGAEGSLDIGESNKRKRKRRNPKSSWLSNLSAEEAALVAKYGPSGKGLDTYGASDQPEACPKDGSRTWWVQTSNRRQIHECQQCGYAFKVEW